MKFLIEFFSIILTTVFIENIVLTKAIGTSTILKITKNKIEILKFGGCLIYISILSNIVSFFIDKLIGNNENSFIYIPIIYILIIGIIYISALLLTWKCAYNFFTKIKKYIHISSFNCTVLGTLFINQIHEYSFLGHIACALGTGIGFIFATYILSEVYDKLNSEDIPESFRGLPAVLIYLGIISMALFALVMKMPEF